MIYLIGSLRNPGVPTLAESLRAEGFDIFDDWYASGPEADDYWQRYEIGRGHSYGQALSGYTACHVFEYDKYHLDRADCGVLAMPAGKSGFLELGYLIGRERPSFIYIPEIPDRFDVMFKFATVVESFEDLVEKLNVVARS